jgi:hypothetical protein
MPNIVEQPRDDGGVMRLYSEQEARRQVRVGINKWLTIRGEIDCTEIAGKRLYSADSLNRFLRRQTRKAPKPRAGRRRAHDSEVRP